MWVFTQNGFYSTVRYEPAMDRHPSDRTRSLIASDAQLLLVRTRAQGDMDRMLDALPGVEFTRTDHADYRFRAVVTADEWLAFLRHETGELDYTNFKDRVTETLGEPRHQLLMRVWSTMRELQR